MSGFFLVADSPSRRLVQYRRVHGDTIGAVYIVDESVLGAAVDVMPFSEKTGIAATATGTVYEVPYLPDAGGVYFAAQPKSDALKDGKASATVEIKGGKAPYDRQWYKDGKQVVNVPAASDSLSVTEPGEYFCVATDADGVEAVSKAAVISEPEVNK